MIKEIELVKYDSKMDRKKLLKESCVPILGLIFSSLVLYGIYVGNESSNLSNAIFICLAILCIISSIWMGISIYIKEVSKK